MWAFVARSLLSGLLMFRIAVKPVDGDKTDASRCAIGQIESQLKVILATNAMIEAYRQGFPAEGGIFPRDPRWSGLNGA